MPRIAEALTALEALKAEKNAISASIGRAADKAAAARELRPQLAALDARIAAAQEALPQLEEAWRAELADVPNVLDDSVPDGAGEAENVVVRTWGEPPAFDFTPLAHWDLGERTGIIDVERAVKLARSRFSILRGPGARLSRALIAFFLDRANAAATRRSSRRSWFPATRCGRPASSRSSPTRCSSTKTRTCSSFRRRKCP